jgi:hypothetical protein
MSEKILADVRVPHRVFSMNSYDGECDDAIKKRYQRK